MTWDTHPQIAFQDVDRPVWWWLGDSGKLFIDNLPPVAVVGVNGGCIARLNDPLYVGLHQWRVENDIGEEIGSGQITIGPGMVVVDGVPLPEPRSA